MKSSLANRLFFGFLLTKVVFLAPRTTDKGE